MKNLTIICVFLIAGVLVAGCASTPMTRELNQAQTFYSNAENDPLVAQYAPVPLHEAQQDLERAMDAETVAEQRHYAFLAEKKVELARTLAQREAIREEAENLQQQQEQFVLELRGQQAQQARMEAAEAREQLRTYRSQEEQRKLEQARREAQEAREELEKLQAKKTENGMLVTLPDLVFEYDTANLKSGALRNLDRLSEFLTKHQDRRILIEGFTDSTGSESYNKRLSKQRAEAVAEALRADGISSDRIITRGMGENFPIAPNDTEAGRQKNRRVEITIMDPEQNPAFPGADRG